MSERGRVEGGKVNSHQHIGEGWTTVERKRRSNRWEGKGRFLHRNPDVGKWWRRIKGTSLFVDDLPPFYDSNLLRSLFKGLGKIIGSFVPWKRRIVANTRYGFVHFEKEEDAAAAMKKLDGAFIFGHKLKIKKSLVIKDTKKEDRRGAFLEKGKNGGSAAFSKGVKSYAEVLASNNLVWARKQKENLTNKEGDAVKVSTRDVNGEMMMQVTVSQWNNIILNQKNLEEKLVNIERWCLDLQEDLRRSRERFEAKEEKEKVSDSVDDLSEEKKEEGLEK